MASTVHLGIQRCDVQVVLSEITALGMLAAWSTVLIGMWGFVPEMFWQRYLGVMARHFCLCALVV